MMYTSKTPHYGSTSSTNLRIFSIRLSWEIVRPFSTCPKVPILSLLKLLQSKRMWSIVSYCFLHLLYRGITVKITIQCKIISKVAIPCNPTTILYWLILIRFRLILMKKVLLECDLVVGNPQIHVIVSFIWLFCTILCFFINATKEEEEEGYVHI